MKKYTLAAAFIVAAFVARGEEAAGPPEGMLRASLVPSARLFDGTAVNLGLGADYGITPWLSLSLDWIPGITLWSTYNGRTETIRFADMNIFGRVQIFGTDALLPLEGMRLAAALGIKYPLPPRNGERELADHLWGAALRVFYDYYVNELYYLNAALEAGYYPDQWLDSPRFRNGEGKPGRVSRPAAFTLEVDNRFTYSLREGMILRGSLPLLLGASLRTAVGGERVSGFGWNVSVRPTAGIYLENLAPLPLELSLGYDFPLAGNPRPKGHSLTLCGRVFIPLPVRPRSKIFVPAPKPEPEAVP